MTVHSIGNGKTCLYCKGPDVFQAFGPRYSSPTSFTLTVSGTDSGKICKTRRLSRLAAYHTSQDSDIIDLVPEEIPVFLRAVRGFVSMTLDLVNGTLGKTHLENTFIALAHPGAVLYPYSFENGKPVGYTSNLPLYTGIAFSGDVKAEIISETRIRFETFGTALFTFAFSEEPEVLFETLAKASVYMPAMENGLADPANLSGVIFSPPRNIGVSPGHPFYREVCEGYDVIVSQQAETGAVLAGYNYRLSYVRDNYGVLRFFLAAGAYGNAKKLLEFYIGVFGRRGCFRNAQGMDEDSFHVHENDNVEITGYMVLMFTAYFRAAGDEETLKKALPLIEYSLAAQHGELSENGTLPFNGDETYVAGGLLPRSVLSDGSFESTVLYFKALTEALEIPLVRDSLDEKMLAELLVDKDLISRNLRKNFLSDEGGFFCNLPSSSNLHKPPFRPGGVRACGHGFGVSFRNKNGDYVCPGCLGKDLPSLFPGLYGKRFSVEAALLSPCFTGASSLLSKELIRKTAEKVRSDLTARNRVVGYEYGILTYALGFDRSLASDMLALRDEFGAWSEYYDNGTQAGTLCRPWETAVNLAALIETFPGG